MLHCNNCGVELMQTEHVCPLCGNMCSSSNEIISFSPAYPKEKMSIRGEHPVVTQAPHSLSLYGMLTFIYSSRTLKDRLSRKLYI